MSGETILVIEDNPVNLEIAIFLLEEAGFSTVSAETAERGIQLAQQSPVALILMDLHLPGMDGFQATRHLKSDALFDDMPIVALTALCTMDDRDKALASGCDGVIEKPIDVETFADTVHRYLHRYKIQADPTCS